MMYITAAGHYIVDLMDMKLFIIGIFINITVPQGW